MYISKLSIKNYRNYTEKTFSIDLKPFTLIIGENNVGKSNLLDSIGLILSQDITMFKKRMLEIDDINYKRRDKFKKDLLNLQIESKDIKFPEVKVEIILEEMNDQQKSIVADWFCDQHLDKAKLTYLFKPRTGFNKEKWVNEQRNKIKDIELEDEQLALVDFPIKEYEYIIFGGKDSTRRCESYFLRMLKLECLDALRDAKRELVASGESRLLFRILNQKNHIEYNDIKLMLQSFEQALKENKNLQTVKSEIISLLEKLSLEEEEGNNDVNFNFTVPETTDILKKLSLIYGNEPISVERNGLGRNNLLYISFVLSQLADNVTSYDSIFFRVVGIEEPEAHLHPHLQQHLSKNINDIIRNRSDMQIILTSHSTHITGSLDLENTVVLYKNVDGSINNHHILNSFKNSAEGKRQRRYIEKYLDATKSCMFYARKIILVEGISEQLLIPKFFELHKNKTIEYFGCNIINVNGVAFKNFLEVVRNGYFIKCAVLTDKDAGKHTENRADELKKEYDNDLIKININEDTFEKELIKCNLNSPGREILLEALEMTRPQNGPKLKDSLGDNPLDVAEFFKEIEDYKAEFAFNLLDVLKEGKKGLVIPNYIKDALDFIGELTYE